MCIWWYGREEKKRKERKKADECSNNIAAAMGFQSAGAFLRHTWVISAPIRSLALRGHFMPPIASNTGTLSTTLGDHPESFSDRKTTERRERFNLKTLCKAARGAFPFACCVVHPVRRHISIIVSTTMATSFLVNQIRRLGSNESYRDGK